jgi:hypothetical protein
MNLLMMADKPIDQYLPKGTWQEYVIPE